MEFNETHAENAVAVTAPQAAAGVEREIDLMELFYALLHNWRAIIIAGLIGATLLAFFHTLFIEPRYQASTELYITNTDSMISLQDLQISSSLTEDYQAIITSRAVLNRVINDLQLSTDYRGLRKLIGVSNPSGTHIINITVTTSDLEMSRDIANDLLNVSIDSIYQIVGTSQPTVIDYAQAEAVQDVTPGFFRYLLIGAVLGVALVAIFTVLRLLLDNTIKNDDDVSKYLQLPVLAAVPIFKE